MRARRKLMTWDRVPGWFCDWHIAGWFDSGLQHNPEPNLFDKKKATRYTEDHLAPWGGVAKITDVPKQTGAAPQIDAPFALLPLTLSPIMSLNSAALEYPDWKKRLGDHNTDTWPKLWYALALVDSPEAQDATLHFSGWDGCRLWINGALSFEEYSYHHIVPDMEKVSFQLKKGLNSFLFQLDRDGLTARIDVAGGPEAVAKLRGIAVGEAPSPKTTSHFAALSRHARTLKVKGGFKGESLDDFRKWHKRFLGFYHRCLGDEIAIAKDEAAPRKIHETKCDGYTRHRYHLPAEGESEIPAYVLIPDAGKRNGRTLVIAHGHENPERTVGVIKPSGPNMTPTKNTVNYAEQMAQKGFVVGMIHERNFGERRDERHGQDPCNDSGLRLQAMGLTLPRVHISDLHRLVRFLGTFPEADLKRMGLGGLSGGGSLSYIAGAFDETFKAVSVFCGMTRYEDYAMGQGCGMQVVPGLYPTGDVGEVLSLIAPRPLLVAQGRFDSTFYVPRVKSIVEDARKAYRAAGAEDRLQLEIMELAHQFDPDVAEKFFLKWL
ncbi:MAG TPA: hypothetical protein VEJ63_01440 [Planctomycetota bacterium]|nr:hypothetical protein [Planctomycetota bacterium]